MPILKSAKKALRQDRRRSKVNAKVRRTMKRAVKLAARQPTEKNISEAYRRVDRAAKKGVVHKNTAARLKARLMQRIKSVKNVTVSKRKSVTKKKVTKRPTTRKITKKRKKHTSQ